MPSLCEAVFANCFEAYDGKFASGKRANNKIDVERLRTIPPLRKVVSSHVARLALRHSPDMIVATPKGGNWLGIDVAYNLGVALTLLHKDEETKQFSLYSGDEDRCASAERIVLLDDIFNELTNTRKVLGIPVIHERAVAAVALLDRGIPSERQALDIPTEAVISKPIPLMLDYSSRLWRFAQ